MKRILLLPKRSILCCSKRVDDTAAQGKSLAEVKKELKMPEYADWHDQNRLGANIDAAWKSVKKVDLQ